MLIRGGTVVTASGQLRADVLVEGERIARVEPEIRGGGPVLDASGLLVLPGLVDPHTHFILDTGSMRTADDFESASKAAAAGGVTTYLDFAPQPPGQSFLDALKARQAQIEGRSLVDYGIHLNITHLDPGWESELARLVEAGVTSAKIYTTYRNTIFYADDWTWWRLMETVGPAGLLVQVHAENDAIVEGMTKQLVAAGRTGYEFHAAARPAIAEHEAVARGLLFSRMSGSPVYFVHLSSPQSIDLVAKARSRGVAALAETCPHYLACDDSVYAGPHAARYLMTPPLRDRVAQAGLWDRVACGEVDTVGSDHCGFALGPREADNDFTRISPGVPGVETTLYVLHTLGVATGRIDLTAMVRLLAHSPARIFGLPSKGDIRPGLDADLILFDPQAEWVLQDGDLHGRAGFSPYSGMRMRGRVMATVCRGQIVYRDGAVVGQPGFGRFVARRPHRPVEDA